MRKDITKKFLGKENRYLGKMISKAIVDFIFRKKINIDANQISCDKIEFMNVFSTETTNINTKNLVGSGYKVKKFVKKNGETIGFNMIYCESGKFEMGSNDPSDKNPKRVVEIERPFLLGETEVTQELYKLVMGNNPSNFQDMLGSNQRPVECVEWYHAIMFCNKLSELNGKSPYYKFNVSSIEINEGANGFRLPYEKEWEYAAKADTNNRWSGTNDESKLEEYAWFKANSNDATKVVATKKPNEWGFYDMSGNVSEWCCWDKFEIDNKIFQRRHTSRGSTFAGDVNLHSTKHYEFDVGTLHKMIGFRIALPFDPIEI